MWHSGTHAHTGRQGFGHKHTPVVSFSAHGVAPALFTHTPRERSLFVKKTVEIYYMLIYAFYAKQRLLQRAVIIAEMMRQSE